MTARINEPACQRGVGPVAQHGVPCATRATASSSASLTTTLFTTTPARTYCRSLGQLTSPPILFVPPPLEPAPAPTSAQQHSQHGSKCRARPGMAGSCPSMPRRQQTSFHHAPGLTCASSSSHQSSPQQVHHRVRIQEALPAALLAASSRADT